MNVADLKQGFDKVEIVHFNSETYKGTHAALIKGDKVYVGFAKCHEDDQFNRKRGREIALGRAMHSWKVDSGITPSRKNGSEKIIFADCKEDVDKIVENLRKEPCLPVVAESAGGCCGGGCK